MKLRRLLSCMMALLLVCGLPLAAFADTYDIAEGSIEISASEDKQTVSQNGNTVDDDVPVITGTTKENTVTITAEKGAAANVTLSGVNIDVGGTGHEPEIAGEAAVRVTGEGDVTIELDGENTVQSGVLRAGVEKNDADSSGSLTITDENGTDGSLKATGGVFGSGIGGGEYGSGSDINITGSAEVTAQGKDGGSGIGGGASRSGSDITISGSAQVEATGGLNGAGIGGGSNWNGKGTGSNITISGDAQVKAQGGNSDYGEGGNYSFGAGAAIGDGGGYIKGNHPEDVKGKDAEVTTDAPQDDESYGLYVGELNEGWVATYAPGEDMDTANPGSLTYQGGIEVKNAVPVPRKEPTCTEAGHEAGYEVEGVLVAVTIPSKGHNVPGGYTPLNNATCTTLGTMTGYCIDCQTTVTVTDPNSTLKDHTFTTYKPDPDHLATCTEDGTKTAVCDVCKNATDTIPDPAKGHSFMDYVADGNATYTEDGTKTAHCDHPGCTETHTIPDPGTRLPLYQVKGKDGARLPCREEKQDGVLTITVEADFATLTGALGGIQILKAQGIDTIVFVTKVAASTFALGDLLEQGSLVESFCLTHDAAAVTFTLGQDTDISKILK